MQKYRGSTFVEALVAQVLVLVIFSAAMISISSVYKMSLKTVDIRLENQLSYLEYQYENKKLNVPYDEQWDHYDISMEKIRENDVNFLSIEVLDKRTKKAKNYSYISGRID